MAPKAIKNIAQQQFRQMVAAGAKNGEVIVIPVLLSSGGIEKEVEEDLAGLKYRFSKALLPHTNVQRWVEEQYRTLIR